MTTITATTAADILARIQGTHNHDFGSYLNEEGGITIYRYEHTVREAVEDSLANLNSDEEKAEALTELEKDYEGHHIEEIHFPALEVSVDTEDIAITVEPVDDMLIRFVAAQLLGELTA